MLLRTDHLPKPSIKLKVKLKPRNYLGTHLKCKGFIISHLHFAIFISQQLGLKYKAVNNRTRQFHSLLSYLGNNINPFFRFRHVITEIVTSRCIILEVHWSRRCTYISQCKRLRRGRTHNRCLK
jgi:hypothetical protein